MELDRFLAIIDSLYIKKDELNTDAMRGRFHDYLFDVSPDDIKNALFSFAKESDGSTKDLDEIILLQRKYRLLFGWDINVVSMIEAGGFMTQKHDEISDYVFQQITMKDEGNKKGYEAYEKGFNDVKYFLVFCLTEGAKINTKVTQLLWRLYWCLWATQWIHDSRTHEEGVPIDEYIELERDVHEGLRDSRKRFDIASDEVISFLISKLADVYYSPPMAWGLLNQILGDTPKVNCLRLNEKGDYTYITRDFSNEVLMLLKDPGNLNLIENFFSKWCRNDIGFRIKVSEVISSDDIEISYFTSFLVMKLKEIKRKIKEGRQIKEELELMSDEEKQEDLLDDIDSWHKRVKRLEEDEKHREFLEYTIERLKNAETKKEEYSTWRNSMYAKRFDRFSFLGEAYDYINYHRFTFSQQVGAGYR